MQMLITSADILKIKQVRYQFVSTQHLLACYLRQRLYNRNFPSLPHTLNTSHVTVAPSARHGAVTNLPSNNVIPLGYFHFWTWSIVSYEGRNYDFRDAPHLKIKWVDIVNLSIQAGVQKRAGVHHRQGLQARGGREGVYLRDQGKNWEQVNWKKIKIKECTSETIIGTQGGHP